MAGPELPAAAEAPLGRVERLLGLVPRMLASKPHILALACLGVYLLVLPLCGVDVGPGAELIGGNYLNVTSDIGACIAAGGTVHLARQHHQLRQEVRELRRHLRRGGVDGGE